jgi:hypothetical protein
MADKNLTTVAGYISTCQPPEHRFQFSLAFNVDSAVFAAFIIFQKVICVHDWIDYWLLLIDNSRFTTHDS